jgi:hypothetical protein
MQIKNSMLHHERIAHQLALPNAHPAHSTPSACSHAAAPSVLPVRHRRRYVLRHPTPTTLYACTAQVAPHAPHLEREGGADRSRS